MDNFFQRIKEARERLSSVAVFVDEEELIHLVLEALPHEDRKSTRLNSVT